jgi:WD domain, G-beta repeat
VVAHSTPETEAAEAPTAAPNAIAQQLADVRALLTRRRLMLGLGGAAGLVVVGGGVILMLQPRLTTEPPPAPTPTEPPPAPAPMRRTDDSIRTFTGHSNPVTSVAFSPDGRTVLSGSFDRTLELWDVATGEALRTFGLPGYVKSVAFSPDGRKALSGGDTGVLKLWDVQSGKELREFAGSFGEVNSVVFSPNGRTALTGHNEPGQDDKLLNLWDVATGSRCGLYGLSTSDENNSTWVFSDFKVTDVK